MFIDFHPENTFISFLMHTLEVCTDLIFQAWPEREIEISVRDGLAPKPNTKFCPGLANLFFSHFGPDRLVLRDFKTGTHNKHNFLLMIYFSEIY